MPQDQLRAERVFGARVLNVYATTEMLVVGMAEPKSEGMVLLEDDLWIEVHDDHLLVTNLRNRTTPLIRYVLSDAVAPSASRDHYAFYRGFRRSKPLPDAGKTNSCCATNRGRKTLSTPS